MSLAEWAERSARMADSHPGMYRQHYPDMLLDESVAMVTPTDFARLMKLPSYDHSMPTGVYRGKLWLRRGHLVAYEPDPRDPEKLAQAKIREIVVVE